MKVWIKLFAGLRSMSPQGGQAGGGEMEFPENSTVAQVLTKLEVPLTEAKIILINGLHAKPESTLKNDDKLSVFPPVGGG